MLARIDTPLGRLLRSEGRTQAWLARQLGVDRQQVGRWVHGLHEPAPDTQVAIATALGRPVADVFSSHEAASNPTGSSSDESERTAA